MCFTTVMQPHGTKYFSHLQLKELKENLCVFKQAQSQSRRDYKKQAVYKNTSFYVINKLQYLIVKGRFYVFKDD